jgi:hypothetical protein
LENTFDHFPSVAAETECNGGLVTTYTVSVGVAVRPDTIPAGGRFCGGENIMMIVLGHFLIAAAAVIATSAIIGYFLTKLLLRLLQKVDRSIRLYRGAKVPAFSAPPRISPTPLSNVSKSFSRNGAEEVWAEYTDPTPREKVVI